MDLDQVKSYNEDVAKLRREMQIMQNMRKLEESGDWFQERELPRLNSRVLRKRLSIVIMHWKICPQPFRIFWMDMESTELSQLPI